MESVRRGPETSVSPVPNLKGCVRQASELKIEDKLNMPINFILLAVVTHEHLKGGEEAVESGN